eukprot:GHVO01013371.1.p1 GENE.GHVO01013371.1~~GHVO01013371.1.p1  ORF type:complete len:209 (-),score=25.35 GHVO01013371.1:94-720(-)
MRELHAKQKGDDASDFKSTLSDATKNLEVKIVQSSIHFGAEAAFLSCGLYANPPAILIAEIDVPIDGGETEVINRKDLRKKLASSVFLNAAYARFGAFASSTGCVVVLSICQGRSGGEFHEYGVDGRESIRFIFPRRSQWMQMRYGNTSPVPRMDMFVSHGASSDDVYFSPLDSKCPVILGIAWGTGEETEAWQIAEENQSHLVGTTI